MKEGIEVFVRDETDSEERPGYDVDVFVVDGDRWEDLCKTGFATKAEAEAYIKNELEPAYQVIRL